VWILGGWCEWRQAFRNFRIDRIEDLGVSDERYRDEPGRTLADLLREDCVNDTRPGRPRTVAALHNAPS
jgi:predicted DNA-binding transcriptional regulator YafY